MARFPSRLVAVCVAVFGLSLAANGSAEATTYYKFYNGTSGYTGDFSGSGTVYAQTKLLSTSCPNGSGPTCNSDVISDPLTFPGLTVTSPSPLVGNNPGVNAPWDDLAPNFGGIGVSDNSSSGGSGDDQITDNEILKLTFSGPVTLTGVATLFDPAHASFGPGDPLTDSFLLQVDNGAFTPVTFLLANTMGLNLTGTSFSFMEKANNPEFYVSAVSIVPLPGALPLFASGLAGLGWLSRRRRKQVCA